jgi:C-terminal processing protease CtpA/Prc
VTDRPQDSQSRTRADCVSLFWGGSSVLLCFCRCPADARPHYESTNDHGMESLQPCIRRVDGGAAFVACRWNGICVADGKVPLMASPIQSMARFSTASYSLPCDDLQPAIKRKRKTNNSTASTLAALFFSASLLISSPNFDGIARPGAATIPFDSTALALEPEVNGESSTWPSSSSALSDQLFKSLADRDSTINPNKRSYWESMLGTLDDVKAANEQLIDHAVATISTMYYDSSGGFNFDPQDFYAEWKKFRYLALHSSIREKKSAESSMFVENGFATRDSAVKTLKSIVSSLNDPYSKYLTREELRMELGGGNDGFLGLGAIVDVSDSSHSLPSAFEFDRNKLIRQVSSTTKVFDRASSRPRQGGVSFKTSVSFNQQFAFPASMKGSTSGLSGSQGKSSSILSVAQAANLPVIKAVVPDSPAERAGLVVGDRIALVGNYKFTGMNRSQVQKALKQRFHAENYFGRVDLTIAKQVFASSSLGLDNGNISFDADGNIVEEKYVFENGWYQPSSRHAIFGFLPSEQVIGYKLSHVKSIPTTATAKSDNTISPINTALLHTNKHNRLPSVMGGDAIVHYELLTPNDSIFQHFLADLDCSRPVGYIRLTRFSKASTAGYINAIESLEEVGAQSYIIDLRNNYGGVIQEAMVTASSLLRDPHSVLCYTLNSRGGFKPQENQEYIVDTKYPGYLLSTESRTVSRDQVRREHPEYLEDGGWSAPTSYASLKELRMMRGIKPAHVTSFGSASVSKIEETKVERPAAFFYRNDIDVETLVDIVTKNSQKKLVILINEGTGKSQ